MFSWSIVHLNSCLAFRAVVDCLLKSLAHKWQGCEDDCENEEQYSSAQSLIRDLIVHFSRNLLLAIGTYYLLWRAQVYGLFAVGLLEQVKLLLVEWISHEFVLFRSLLLDTHILRKSKLELNGLAVCVDVYNRLAWLVRNFHLQEIGSVSTWESS